MELRLAVGKTGQYMAACRAKESERPGRLFEDPYATEFSGAFGFEMLEGVSQHTGAQVSSLVDYAAVRTRFIDDVVQRCVENGILQFVVPGVGGDARSYRMPALREARVFEIDLPEVIEFRKAVIASVHSARNAHEHAEIVTIADDLSLTSMRDLLGANGFNVDLPTGWIVEGFVMYLSEERVDDFLLDVSFLSAPGSVLVCDVFFGPFLDHAMTQPFLDAWSKFADPPRSVLKDASGCFDKLGFDLEEYEFGDPEVDYGRIPAASKAFWGANPRTAENPIPRNLMILATKR